MTEPKGLIQRFQWFALRRTTFSVLSYDDDGMLPPHVVLECASCRWRAYYPDLSYGNDIAYDATNHELSCDPQ